MRSELAAALAENTKKLMLERGWSQRELAKRAHLSQMGVNYVLNYRDASDRHATIDKVEALALAFGVAPHRLLGGSELSLSARNVHQMAPRQAKKHPHERDEETHPSSPSPADIELIATLVLQHKRGTAEQRAALIRKLVEAYSDGSEKPSHASVLRLVRSA